MARLLTARIALALASLLLSQHAISGNPPKKQEISGVAVGSTIAQIDAWAEKRYPLCRPVIVPPKDQIDGERMMSDVYRINLWPAPDLRPCFYSQWYEGVSDIWNISITSPETELGGQAYSIRLSRSFNADKNPRKLSDVKRELISEYGVPAFEGSSALDVEEYRQSIDEVVRKTLKPGSDSKRVERKITLYWGSAKFNPKRASCAPDCAGVFLIARIKTYWNPEVATFDQGIVDQVEFVLFDMVRYKAQEAWASKKRESTKPD